MLMGLTMNKLRLQTLVVVGAGHAVGSNTATVSDGSGNYLITTRVMSPGSGMVVASPKMESRIVRETFSSVPMISRHELATEFRELGEALAEMRELDEDSEGRIDPPVYETAYRVAAELMAYSFPAPQAFTHGPKSVVFNWTRECNNLYLTVSADRISALVSTPARIKRRLEF